MRRESDLDPLPDPRLNEDQLRGGPSPARAGRRRREAAIRAAGWVPPPHEPGGGPTKIEAISHARRGEGSCSRRAPPLIVRRMARQDPAYKRLFSQPHMVEDITGEEERGLREGYHARVRHSRSLHRGGGLPSFSQVERALEERRGTGSAARAIRDAPSVSGVDGRAGAASTSGR